MVAVVLVRRARARRRAVVLRATFCRIDLRQVNFPPDPVRANVLVRGSAPEPVIVPMLVIGKATAKTGAIRRATAVVIVARRFLTTAPGGSTTDSSGNPTAWSVVITFATT